jgi:hypothetical protein
MPNAAASVRYINKAAARDLGKGTAEAAYQKDSSTSAAADQRKHHAANFSNRLLKPNQQQRTSVTSIITKHATNSSALGPQPGAARHAAVSNTMAAGSAVSSFSPASATDSVHSNQRPHPPSTPPCGTAPGGRDGEALAGPPTSLSVSQPVQKTTPHLPFQGLSRKAAAAPPAPSQLAGRKTSGGQAAEFKAPRGSTGTCLAEKSGKHIAADIRPHITPPNAAGLKSLLMASTTASSAAGRDSQPSPEAVAAAAAAAAGALFASKKATHAPASCRGAKPGSAAARGSATAAVVQPSPSPEGRFTLLVTPGGPSWPANAKGIGMLGQFSVLLAAQVTMQHQLPVVDMSAAAERTRDAGS